MTTFADDFNRANELLAASANWDAIANVFEILNNVVECNTNSANVVAMLNETANNFADDQESSAIIGNIDADNFVGVACRVQAANGGCYTFVSDGGLTVGRMYRLDTDMSATAIGSQVTIANGDRIAVRAIGTTISARVNDVEQDSVTDATFSTGQPGLYGYNGDSGNETTLDDFQATDEFGGGATVIVPSRSMMGVGL